jgi:hypothetical protein
LAYERSWFLVVVGLWGVGGVIYFCLETNSLLASGDILLPLVAGPAALLLIRRGLTGSRSKSQLWVDVPAGKLVLMNGTEHELSELGTISVEQRYHQRNAKTVATYGLDLKASALEHPIYCSFLDSEVKRRCEALQAAILQSALRKLLERPQLGDTFRAGPELTAEAVARAGSPERALAGLRVLAREDHDLAIREQATKLAALLRQGVKAAA